MIKIVKIVKQQVLEIGGKRGELIFLLVSLGVSIYLLYGATQLPGPTRPGDVGAAFFPKMVLIAAIILIVNLIYANIKSGAVEELAAMENPRNFWIPVGIALTYIFLIDIVGFIVLSPILIVTSMYLVGIRHWKWLVGVTAALSIFLTVVFPIIMNTPLPRGVGIFRMISLMIY